MLLILAKREESCNQIVTVALRPGILGIADGRRGTLDHAEMIMSSANFDVVKLKIGGGYEETISLTIKKFKPSDEGTYTCTSTNSLGKKESTVRLYGKT